jgi:hypothetical protein
MTYWTGLAIIQQASKELGLGSPTTLVGTTDVQILQLQAFLNAAGNELITYYPWAQLKYQWEFVATGVESYDLPADWNYFVDQTQWDRTNHWPLLGPRSPQEWAWLKGGLVAAAPRARYRVMDNKLWLWPVTTTSSIAMEYVSNCYAKDGSSVPIQMVQADDDVPQLEAWLLVKFVKLKFYQLKGFDTTGVLSDFTRLFDSLTGKDTGAEILSLNRGLPNMFIGPWSVPDGSWNVGP